MELAFNEKFFRHINAGYIKEGKSPSKIFGLAEKLINFKIINFLLSLFEYTLGFILALPIPLYSTLIYLFITNYPGSPGFIGMYLRSVYYRRKLKKMESNVLIDQNVFIAYPEKTELKEFSYIDKNVTIMSKSCLVGRRVHIAPRVLISGGGDFEIEDYACIATGSNIITSTEVLKDGARCSGPMVDPSQRNVFRGKVLIKKDAFIGANVTVLPGVVVAEGSVAGAGITLSKNTEPWGVYLGSKTSQVSTRHPVKGEDN